MTLTTLLYFKLAKELPIFIYLFRKSEATTLTVKELQQLLKPEFSESGSNARMYKGMYTVLSLSMLEKLQVSQKSFQQFTINSVEKHKNLYILYPTIVKLNVI